MKKLITCVLLSCSLTMFAQEKKTDLRSLLLEQLKSTRSVKDWFVPTDTAIAGLTAKQAMWKDSSDNHSVAQLTRHLIFWNEQVLAQLKGIKPAAFNGNNKETFSGVDEVSWPANVKKLDSVLTAIGQWVIAADEVKLMKAASTIMHVGTHNAYHTGQIIYIRKMKGWWNDASGVK